MTSHQTIKKRQLRNPQVRSTIRRLLGGMLGGALSIELLCSGALAQDIPNRYSQPGYQTAQPNYPFVPGQYPSAPAVTNEPWNNPAQVITPAPTAQPYVGQPTYPNAAPQPGVYSQQPGTYAQQPGVYAQQPNTFAAPSGTYVPQPTYPNAESVQAIPSPYAAPQNTLPAPTSLGAPLQPLTAPWMIDADEGKISAGLYQPRVRDVPIDVFLQEAQTGRFILGGSVNTDLGVAGQVIIEERNFDIKRFPTSFRDMFNGAFRGAGQNFRIEAVPGSQVQRYSVDWTEPNLFGYSPYSLSVGGFLFDRFYQDYNEERLGGRVSIGYVVTPDLQVSTEIRAENVEISNPRIGGVDILDRALGDSDIYTGRVRLTHNTRDSPFLPTEGHFFEAIYDQVFGEFDFPRGQINYSRYFLIRERADGGGRHTFTVSNRLGFSGADTPIFENFFAGGFSTLRGFRFRGASPTENTVQVGGRFQFLGSMEYMMPVTADDMIRVVSFVDYGIIERDIDWSWDNFRVAPGLGLRIAVPAMGPAPLAFDFAFPLNKADGDQTQVFSFNVGLTR
jgi:outer membrane protein insertion porin family